MDLYRPSPAPNSHFFHEIEPLLQELNDMPGSSVVCGDFNCPGATSDKVNAHLTESIKSLNFTCVVTGGTIVTTSGNDNVVFYNWIGLDSSE